MIFSFWRRLKQSFINWLIREPTKMGFPLCDFGRIKHEVRPCDVLLIEGRSRVSNVIRLIIHNTWSHSAMYLGRLHDIEDDAMRQQVIEFCNPPPDRQLIIESLLGKGTVIHPIERYEGFHIRICRPKGISHADSQNVINYTIKKLGKEYSIRHNLDLARFLLPWSIMPRRWRSVLFEAPGEQTKEICSSMLAEAFNSVHFPILPRIKEHKEKGIELFRRNPRLFTPADFDYSPYFEIIKYPFFELEEHAIYRKLPWNTEGILSDDEEDEAVMHDEEPEE